MLMRLFTFLLLLLAAQAQAQAQVVRWPLMRVPEASEPVRLQSLAIRGAVSGSMAETTVRMVFFNPNLRQLEGTLEFPLAEGQQLTGFSLDIDGALRPAVPVEKKRGREILEAEERRGIDPGLLEQTAGNQFRLRVYPIPAGGSRTVELRYVETLKREQGRLAWLLPLSYGAPPQDTRLELDLSGVREEPALIGASGLLNFERYAGGYRARLARPLKAADGAVKLLLDADLAQRVYVQEFGGARYFMAELPVGTQRVARPLPKVVGLLWDSSGSAASHPREAQLQALDRYFKALGRAEVRLIRLRDRAEAPQVFRIAEGNWEMLRKALSTTVYDGASALGDWKPQADVGEYLLFSDGLNNYGSQRFPALAANQRLYALAPQLGADTARLAALAERSGGQLTAIDPQRPEAAAEALLSDGPQLRAMGASGAGELLADVAGARDGLLRVAGKLSAATARVELTVLEQGKPRAIAFDIDAATPSGSLAAWWWASRKLQELDGEHELRRGAIRRLGAEFGIPSRETSLIVLERLEDYVRHEVLPPEPMRAAYDKLKMVRGQQLAQKRQKQLDSVVRAFERKVAWWEKSYPKDMPLPVKPRPPVVLQDGMYERSESPQAMRLPTPAPAAPPPPSYLAPGGVASNFASADTRMVTVTGSSISRDAEVESRQNGGASIALKKWQADAPYIQRMKAAAPDRMYAVYLDERPSYLNSSAFFLDAAGILFDKGQRELALRVLSNLAEMELENRQVLRVLGYRLMQAGAPELAVPVFEQVQLLGEEEPQSFRDLGLALADCGRWQRAVDQLYEVVLRPWDGRFPEIELIALAEMNEALAKAQAKGVKVDVSQIDSRLLKNLPLDLRVVLTWDADNSDMDLWVTDPNGERSFYGHRLTYQGGMMSPDMTGGYGPEEFSLRHAKPGVYRVEANFYGHRQQIVAGATTLQLKFSTGFGTAAAKDQMVTLRLAGQGSTVLVGEFEVKPKK
ncbi:VIT domain-containing protein [Massilia sp. YIM B04103]|uniref:VIT domain-containing protein n=1 Tax=Massilia sp. YIM B04103 TaxID=2963106 RepID=UPI00210CCCCA|nr:VIT domain-containing protein [Massilia sp. YIM B04103]